MIDLSLALNVLFNFLTAEEIFEGGINYCQEIDILLKCYSMDKKQRTVLLNERVL